jgi:hypothetical protein
LKLIKAKAEAVCRNPTVQELKEKLVEVKTKCENFKYACDDGIEQISGHCALLRNQVDIATECLIEKAHSFSEKMISDIDKYEKESIQSFKSTKLQRNNEIDELKVEVNKFHMETSRYLDELNIDDTIVEESLKNVAKMIQEMNDVDDPFKNTKMEFVRSDTFEMPCFGCLVNKSTSTTTETSVSPVMLQQNPSPPATAHFGRQAFNAIYNWILRQLAGMSDEALECLLYIVVFPVAVIIAILVFMYGLMFFVTSCRFLSNMTGFANMMSSIGQ